MQIGAEISRGGVEASTVIWIFCDLAVFGEYVSVTEGENWMLLRNETESKSKLMEAVTVNSMGGLED
jgi:hypothetical protein